ncbi:MAG: DHH family phosphoesterase [Candidatus Thermoplasmatota archaeon]|nr:DHH family phosphoesterase [Candidatus Thermoplasmatota archaeon]MBS3802269.1 DHH family phosphoesterase [Candidatus Thermoplasmatota archaeon]
MNEFDQLQGKGLLIHHWDADGICSAKLVIDKLGKKITTNKTPTLGNYFLTDEELKECKGFDFVIVVDMSLPEQNILHLAKESKVLIFDHHLGKVIKEVFHHNPVIKGEDPDEYPSASWIVNDYLENDVNLYGLLGIIGDHEQKIKENPHFSKIIDSFCKKNNITFDDLHKMAYLLDSNYKKGDKKAVEQAPYYLIDHPEHKAILENTTWNNNLTELDEEINTILDESINKTDSIILKTMNTKSNIISTITRKLAWTNNQDAVVVNKGYFDSEDQLYVRTIDNDMQPMIKKGKEYGFKCGGKKEVLGAILPKEKTESFVNEIVTYLSKQ